MSDHDAHYIKMRSMYMHEALTLAMCNMTNQNLAITELWLRGDNATGIIVMLLWNEAVDSDASIFICVRHSSAIGLA